MLLQRVLTALILIPIALGIMIYLNSNAFLIFTALIVLGGAWEWTNFMQLKTTWTRFAYLACIVLMLYAALHIPLLTLLIGAVWWVLATVSLVLYHFGIRVIRGPSRGVIGVLVLVPCWLAINLIRKDNVNPLLFFFILIWLADSIAYFVGRKWGKTKFAPNISPQKSVQGAVAALVSAIGITLLACWYFHFPTNTWFWACILAMVTVAFSIVGDLFESMLKREAGLKDSGKLLPGHGGILDRMDSLTAAAPIFVLGAILMGMYL
jgi:phosphatidate cytidylyltransferase